LAPILAKKIKQNRMDVKKNVLVVEDNKETQLLIKVSLRNNYNVDLTDNVSNALSFLTKTSYDLVFLDLNLRDEEDGKKVLEYIRNGYDKPDIPVIIVTAYDLTKVDKDFLESNSTEIIAKPIDNKKILELVKAHIKNN